MPGHRKRRQFKQTDAFTRGMVIGLKRAGWSIRQIAADTHLGASTVHRLWRRWLEQGNVAIYRNAGATRVTSARVDRRILRQAVAAPQATCTAILQHVQDTLDHSISTRTISRRLVANGLHSCRPLRRLPLTPPNRRQRLEWCRARSTWVTEWHRVVSNPAAIVERPTVRQRGIMVWGAIAYDSRSPLLRIQGTMTAQRYVDDVLRPVTLPYLQGVPNALYQQDNARPHTARISQQALQDVQMLPWPPYSPDLSPIEHVWDIIGRRLHALPQPRSEDELWQKVEREWRAIPQDAIRTLIDSLPRRVAACIATHARKHGSTMGLTRQVTQNAQLVPIAMMMGDLHPTCLSDLLETLDNKPDCPGIERIRMAEHERSVKRKFPDVPQFLHKFSAAHVYLHTASHGIEVLQRLKRYKQAAELLQFLLQQKVTHVYTPFHEEGQRLAGIAVYICVDWDLCQDHRGRWWERLALNWEVHLKDRTQSLQVLEQALQDPALKPAHIHSLLSRLQRLSPDSAAQLATTVPLAPSIPMVAAPNMEYKRCSSWIHRIGALTEYYQPGQLSPGFSASLLLLALLFHPGLGLAKAEFPTSIIIPRYNSPKELKVLMTIKECGAISSKDRIPIWHFPPHNTEENNTLEQLSQRPSKETRISAAGARAYYPMVRLYKNTDWGHCSLESVRVTIEGQLVPKAVPGRRNVFMTSGGAGDVVVVSVEGVALQHYKDVGYSCGVHGEGATMCSLFGLFLWDSIYQAMENVFITPYQSTPLDLTSLHFLESRRESITATLAAVRDFTPQELESRVQEVWEAHHGESSLVSWDLFTSLSHLQLIADICERLAADFRHWRSGAPDLVVWQPGLEHRFRFVEVKGPGDQLSSKQTLWLDFLANSCQVPAEVCYVLGGFSFYSQTLSEARMYADLMDNYTLMYSQEREWLLLITKQLDEHGFMEFV
ncbi:FAN1 [Cordylochernes scorpioides]|uniref:Fanconi-associated nuclease n=1 Tax=Cordylochernes scorpioides TaxID=51811 RepID=A0ABY6KLW8_9ARAC|nr:FAN1 [Cordylochernes scorpioides]